MLWFTGFFNYFNSESEMKYTRNYRQNFLRSWHHSNYDFPDFDKQFHDLRKKFFSNFGGPNKVGSFNGKKIGWIVFILCILSWLSTGFYIVQEGQVGVVTQFGKFHHVSNSGFQWRLPYPIQHEEIVNISKLRTFEVGFRGSAKNKILSEALMLTTDENIVDMQFVVQYRLKSDGAPEYLFKTKQPDDAVRQSAQTAMREVVGKKTMDFVLYEGRTQVADEVQYLMQSILDRYHVGVQVSTVAIQNVQPPEQVQAAFDDAVKAGQDRERQINEGQAYANQIVPFAKGRAFRMLEQAGGYKSKVINNAEGDVARFNRILHEYSKAPVIMRQRLYIETMQDIFSKSSKVFINNPSTNNLIVLPFDKSIHNANMSDLQVSNEMIASTLAKKNISQPFNTSREHE